MIRKFRKKRMYKKMRREMIRDSHRLMRNMILSIDDNSSQEKIDIINDKTDNIIDYISKIDNELKE